MTVFALLLSLLLGFAPAAAAAADLDRSAVRLGKAEPGKASAVLRTGGRVHGDDQEGDELVAPPPARILASSLSQFPAQAVIADANPGANAPLPRAYQARAPPAA